MLGLTFHHIGIACKDIAAAANFVRKAYPITSDSGTVFDPLQDANVRLFNAGLPGAIELVSGKIVEGLVKHHTTFYHVCYSTPDLLATLDSAARCGTIPAGPPRPAVLFENRLVAFVYTPLGLIEFLAES